jgi:hypothetical protein
VRGNRGLSILLPLVLLHTAVTWQSPTALRAQAGTATSEQAARASAYPLATLDAARPVRLPPVELWSARPPASVASLLDGDVASAVYSDVQPAAYQADINGRVPWRAGAFSVVPYGALWADMIFATSRTNPGAYTLWVFSREDQGEAAFTVDARRTRVGLDIQGPELPLLGGAESSGRVEIDFHGDFVTENRPAVLLRQAYWQAESDEYRLLVGQTWDVISPLMPARLDYAVGLAAGNIGFRRAQFRAERYLAFSDTLLFSVEGSLNQDIVVDFRTEPGVRREAASWPVIEGRLATTVGPRGDGCNPLVFGVSGHVGETGFDFLTDGPPPLNLPPQDDARFFTWSFNVDVYAPLTQCMGLQGEFFTGANLSSFFGGIGQGVCPCLRVPIRASGGWLDVWYDWSPRLRSHFGFGIDDPINRDSLFGRTYNQYIYANLVAKITDRFTTGIEVTSWKTLYQERRAGQIPADQLMSTAPGESITIDWMVKYGF